MAYYNSRNRGSYNSRPTYQKKAPTVVEFVPPTFTPSAYQTAIVEHIRTQVTSLIVDAKAGTGKTSTLSLLVAALLEMNKSYIVVAFNKSIATTLQEKGMNGKTFHSTGYSAVMSACVARNNGIRPEMDAKKVARIIADTYPDSEGYAGAVERLVSLMKNHMMTPEATDDDIVSIIEHFDIETADENIQDNDLCDMARNVLSLSIRDTRVIDFDDQLYLVYLWNLRIPQYDYILVDESQDTNPLRRDLVRRMMHRTSRVVAVGDPQQAIYGFTGASADSMAQIARAFRCDTLPLNTCYRCSKAVIRHAQEIVPDIEWAEGAPEGSVTTVPTYKRSDFLPTDMILCRNTAPLVATAYKLLAARIPCRIMGREIGRSLTSLIKRLSRKNETLDSLMDRLADHKATEVEKALKQRKETKAQSITDKVDAIMAIIDSMTPEDTERGINGLIAIIDSMFSDTKNGCVTLATVHKAKGLEAPRVFILDRHLMPSKMARQEWQMTQEINLMYVARTRAMVDLVYVDSKNLTD